MSRKNETIRKRTLENTRYNIFTIDNLICITVIGVIYVIYLNTYIIRVLKYSAYLEIMTILEEQYNDYKTIQR